MPEFKKGQLVAVKVYSDENWEPAIFERKEGIFYICRSLLNRDAWLRRPWSKAKPAEEVWPDIFLGWERSAGEQAADAVAMESELVKRLRRQIEWLCQKLNQINSGSDEMCHCPDPELRFSPKPMDCHPEGCASCWRDACRKAAKEEPCP
jgi:hypothetical protein